MFCSELLHRSVSVLHSSVILTILEFEREFDVGASDVGAMRLKERERESLHRWSITKSWSTWSTTHTSCNRSR